VPRAPISSSFSPPVSLHTTLDHILWIGGHPGEYTGKSSSQENQPVLVLFASGHQLKGGEVAEEGNWLPCQSCRVASGKPNQPSSTPNLGRNLLDRKLRSHLLLNLHNLNGADNEGPDKPCTQTVSPSIQCSFVSPFPTSKAVDTKCD